MPHGTQHLDILAPRSRLYQGPFGRICPDLPRWEPGVPDVDQFLLDVADDMVELPGKTPTEIAEDPSIVAQLDADFGSDVPAGYTYFGQFVDHDVTFDPISSLMRENDPNGLLNFRTPRLDLDNVYGRGPSATCETTRMRSSVNSSWHSFSRTTSWSPALVLPATQTRLNRLARPCGGCISTSCGTTS